MRAGGDQEFENATNRKQKHYQYFSMVGAFPALLALCAINQGFDPNMFGKGGPACKAYTCSKGFVPVPKRPLRFVVLSHLHRLTLVVINLRLKSPGCHGFGMSMFSGVLVIL